MSYRNVSRLGPMVGGLALAALAACGPSEEIQQQLLELQAVSVEKDSLIVQVAENARIMSQIGAEIAKVQAPASQAGSQEVSGTPAPDAILQSIQALTARVTESEDRLAESQRRIQALTRDSRTQQTRLAEFQRTVEEFQATIENQKQTIVSLTEQVTMLQQENVELTARNTELTSSVERMTERENTAYYVIGTKDELLQQGIVTEEGGSRVLFVFGKRGKTLVPSREQDLSLFTRIDIGRTTTIPLTEPEATYRIVSLQDLSALASPPDEDGRFRGEISIAEPDRFWATNRVLIIVRT